MMEDVKLGFMILVMFLVIAFAVKFTLNKTKQVNI